MSARPLSPHLSVYKFMYTMALSILHRITAVVLSAGLLVLVWWLMALASGAGAYQRTHAWLANGWMRLLLAAWLLAFVYHLCNGIRHLCWDAGLGLEKVEARRSAAATLLATLVIFLALGYLLFITRLSSAS
jgi:succinate dehydrogenase / fumarate reductase cytochrome b subunit